jgi:hypothetical protein
MAPSLLIEFGFETPRRPRLDILIARIAPGHGVPAPAYLQSGLTILWEPGDLLLGPVPARQVRQ